VVEKNKQRLTILFTTTKKKSMTVAT